MKIQRMQKLLLGFVLACICAINVHCQTIMAESVFKHITIDGSFTDWTDVPLAYSQAQPPGDIVAFKNLYIANDQSYLYIRFSLYNSTNPFTSKQNIFIDTDHNASTGYSEHGIGSEALIQSGNGYRETNGIFNAGSINGLSWLASPAGSGTDFEVRISLNATYTDSSPVFVSNTFAIFLESSESAGNEWFPNVTGGLTYTLAQELGIMVPAYFNPSSHAAYWNELDFGATKLPLIAVMNPDSGPGTSQSASYTNALLQLHQAGGGVIGYVYTSQGSRALSAVEADINTYISWYDVDGFFLDEMANDANTNHYNYYQTIYQYIKSKGAQYTVTGNPGANTQQSYISIPTVDMAMIFEGYSTNYTTWSPSSWVTNYPPAQFINLPHDVTSTTIMTNDINLAVSRNAGWVFVTDSSYSDMPAYWTNEVNFIHSINNP
jgi:hypothetical protein